MFGAKIRNEGHSVYPEGTACRTNENGAFSGGTRSLRGGGGVRRGWSFWGIFSDKVACSLCLKVGVAATCPLRVSRG